jgi:hypothetical protein
MNLATFYTLSLDTFRVWSADARGDSGDFVLGD